MINWRNMLIVPTASILDAMKKIDSAGTQFLIVADENDRLFGVVTDGDIRRGILHNVPLGHPVSEIMNTQPRVLFHNVSRADAISFLRSNRISHVPLVSTDKVVMDVVSSDDRLAVATHPNSVVMMVGGLGTRLGELTTNCPKPMLPIKGRPVLEIILQDLIDSGFKDFIFCVNFRAEMIRAHFGDGKNFGVSIRYVEEEKRLGTAGALSLLPKDVVGPILVMNGDIVTKVNFTRLLDFHSERPVEATMAVRKYDVQIPFGVVSTSEGFIKEVEEKPIHSFLVSAGIYVINTDTLSHIPADEFFDMPQLFNDLVQVDKKTQAFPIHEYWLDIGRQDDLARAEAELGKVVKEK